MVLRYPLDLTTGDVDYVAFKHFDWSLRAAQPGAGGDIILYMPNSTPAVANNQGWGESSASGPLGDFVRTTASNAAGVLATAGDDEVGTQIDKLKSEFSQGLSNGKGTGALKQAGIQGIANMANQQPNQLLALSIGKVYNPNIELLYQGPKLRGFNFNYTFVPKSEAEAVAAGRIIKEFKIWSSPKDTGNGMYKVPQVWQVSYMTGGGLNRNMNCFKKAALTSISVQANPGLPMHMSFNNGMPIITQVSLSFTEVDVITRDDQESAPSNFGF